MMMTRALPDPAATCAKADRSARLPAKVAETAAPPESHAEGSARRSPLPASEKIAGLSNRGAAADDRGRLIGESVELICQLAVIWRACGIHPSEIWAEMARHDVAGDIFGKPIRERGGTPAPEAVPRAAERPGRPHYRRGDTIGPVAMSRMQPRC